MKLSISISNSEASKYSISCFIGSESNNCSLMVSVDYSADNIALIILLTVIEAGNGNVLTLKVYSFIVYTRIDKNSIAILGCYNAFRNGSKISRPILLYLPGNR